MAKKDLSALVRLNRWKVDEQSRALAALLNEEADFKRMDRILADEMEREKKAADMSVEIAETFGRYLHRMKERRARLAEDLAKLEVRIETARDNLREAMNEAKKYEIAEAARLAAEAEAEKTREAQILDEVALEGFRRQKK